MAMYRKPKAWQLDYDKAYVRKRGYVWFSLGVFRWIPTTNQKRLKRGPIIMLFSCVTNEAEQFIRCLERAEKNPHCGGK